MIINDNDLPQTIQFAAPKFTVLGGVGEASMTVVRSGGTGGLVTVAYTTFGDSAAPGVDFAPVSGTLTFNPGESIKNITIPILGNPPVGVTEVFGVALSNPSVGTVLGTINPTLMLIRGQSSTVVSSPGPVVLSLQPVVGKQGITAIDLTFNAPLNPVRAQDLGSYGYFVLSAGPDGVFGTSDDGAIPLVSAAYNPAANLVILTPSAPLPANRLYRILINGQANPALGTGLTDTAGNLLDSDQDGRAGGIYVGVFGSVVSTPVKSAPVRFAPVHRFHPTKRLVPKVHRVFLRTLKKG